MAYVSKRGRRPIEKASKSSHSYVIKDSDVQYFLSNCDLPKTTEEIDANHFNTFEINQLDSREIQRVIAFDGSYREISVRNDFPSSKIAFFQLGASFFKVSDLDEIHELSFIDEEDMESLRQIERLKFVIPIKGISLDGETSLTKSVRKTVYDVFMNKPDESNYFIDTLKWFIYKEYKGKERSDTDLSYQLGSCPNINCEKRAINLSFKEMSSDGIFNCPECKGEIYLTDVFRLHEAIDEELGAGGILGYVVTLMEQIFIIHIIKLMLQTKSSLLNETMFIKDGPLAFFGQTANMHKLMREMINYLIDKRNLFLIGLEKSGSFVEHADKIKNKLKKGEALLLDNNYIYKYILPGKADPENPYASTSYYSGKVIYKDNNERIYVATLPTKDAKVILNPKKEDYRNIDIILTNIEKLKCDMYDDALLPVALVNKLISLADHPSSTILEKFAKSNI
ncbi:DNA double-strand break repair nuclease NurA [Virgibacillus alimentarius]|uniref:DNA double-strand break repair nuclease NurA n=1 Tax=Virgibacillus alimentarius TaxID=698769 RepID=UPI000492ED45|nr:DNA double-strand break repair nuclease NurA [Virgibacillus alimentarius]